MVNVSLPSWDNCALTELDKIPIAVIDPTIERMPTATESIVKYARSLFERSDVNAIRMFSLISIIHIVMHQQGQAAMHVRQGKYQIRYRSVAIRRVRRTHKIPGILSGVL